jgi:hypothetical protein
LYLTVPLPDGTEYTFHGQMQRIHKEGDRYLCGVKLLLDDNSYPKAVAFVYGNSARWLGIWMQKSVNPGALRMLYKLLMLGLKGTLVSSTLLFGILQSVFHYGLRSVKSAWKTFSEVTP